MPPRQSSLGERQPLKIRTCFSNLQQVVDVNHVVTQLLLHLASSAASQSQLSKLAKSDSKEKGLKFQRISNDSAVQSSPSSPKSVTSKREQRTVRACSAESNNSNANNVQGFETKKQVSGHVTKIVFYVFLFRFFRGTIFFLSQTNRSFDRLNSFLMV